MAIYAVGDEQDSYQIHTGSFAGVQTFSKPTGARVGPYTTNINTLRLDLNTSVSEVWIHAHVYPSGGTNDNSPVLSLYNRTNSRASVRWVTPSSGGGNSTTHRLQYTSNGTTWVDILTFYMTANSNLIDIYFKGGASGEAKVFIGGQLQVSASGSWTLNDSTFDSIVFGSSSSSTNYWGGVIVASEPTINWTIDTIEPNAAGNSSDWTGAYTAIDESTYDDSDFITTNTVGHKFLSNLASMAALPAGRRIAGVCMAARGMITPGAVSSVNFLSRHGSTDYTHGNVGLVSGGGVRSGQEILELNPAGGAWTESDITNFQFGVISA